MQWSLVILGSFLLGQSSAMTPPSPAAGLAGAKMMPPEMIDEALALRPGGAITGRPLSLAAALSSAADQRQQLDITRAYWRLAEAVAAYNFSLDHDQRLGQLAARPEETLLLRAARASSAASLQESELGAIAAQHELAALLTLAASAPLPLPADRPHVGAYRTRFQELYAGRGAPARARLIDQTLPLRRRAIDVRASAVEAAREALATAVEAYPAGRGNLSTVLSGMDELRRQQQAFAALACQYNHDIADYVFNVVSPGASGPALVGMLIAPLREPIRPVSSEEDAAAAGQPEPARRGSAGPSDRQAAVLNEAMPGKPLGAAQQPGAARPTPAPRWTDPALSPLRANAGAPPAGAKPTLVPVPTEPDLAPAPDGKTAAPAEDAIGSPATALPVGPIVPVRPKPTEPAPRTSNKPAIDSRAGPAVMPQALYPGLVDAKPAAQARELSRALHWDRMLPDGAAQPIGLLECVRSRPAGERRLVIDAYWLARQRAAEYQVRAQQVQWLEGLISMPAERGSSAAGRESLLRLQAARLAADADLLEARVALIDAQCELARRIGRESEVPWPLPSTAPHAGQYLLQLDAQPREPVSSRPTQRLAAVIPLLAESLQQHAKAVVEADTARAAETASCEAGGESIDQVLAAIARQTDQSLAFLKALTDYNQAMGRHALAVLPPEVSSEKLVATLVPAGSAQ